MSRKGFLKFQRSGLRGKRIKKLGTDARRWRWWKLTCLADMTVFPGLLAHGLEPMTDMEIATNVYNSEEFKSPIEAFKAWEEERSLLLLSGLLKAVVIEGDTYLWLADFHVHQDKYSSKGKTFLFKFYKSLVEKDENGNLLLSDDEISVFLILLEAFRPQGVELEVFGLPLDPPLVQPSEQPFTLPCARPFTRRSGHEVKKERSKEVKSKEELLQGLDKWLHEWWGKKGDSEKANPEIKKFLDWYYTHYKQKFKLPYLITSKDAGITKRLLGTYGYEKLIAMAEKFFESEDPFVRRAGYTIGVLSSQVNSLVPKIQKALGGNKRPCGKCKSTDYSSMIDGECSGCYQERRQRGKNVPK